MANTTRHAKTKKAYTEQLNDTYASMDVKDVTDSLLYLTNPGRGEHTTLNNLRKAYFSEKVGELLRKLDSIAFHTGYNEFLRS